MAAAAKRAALTAEAPALHKPQALQEEELRLKQESALIKRKRELDLETEIAKAETEERAYVITELQDPSTSIKQLSRAPSQVTTLNSHTHFTTTPL